ncbi:ribbon-helix-helix protein, CopG family [Micrococcaceae bacterium RIT802]|nr:ribbon-helix-helix protein, CopG family [Micrococcaceae bacterium RIT 802]
MQRTQISLTAGERRTLDAEAARTGRSISALIRDAESDLQAIDAACGSWDERRLEGAAFVEGLRSGSRLADGPTR